MSEITGGIGPVVRLTFSRDEFNCEKGWSYRVSGNSEYYTSGPYSTIEEAKEDAKDYFKLRTCPIEITTEGETV